jgi:hypothetical protein
MLAVQSLSGMLCIFLLVGNAPFSSAAPVSRSLEGISINEGY